MHRGEEFYALSKIGAVVDISDPLINENVMSNYLKDTNSKYGTLIYLGNKFSILNN